MQRVLIAVAQVTTRSIVSLGSRTATKTASVAQVQRVRAYSTLQIPMAVTIAAQFSVQQFQAAKFGAPLTIDASEYLKHVLCSRCSKEYSTHSSPNQQASVLTDSQRMQIETLRRCASLCWDQVGEPCHYRKVL